MLGFIQKSSSEVVNVIKYISQKGHFPLLFRHFANLSGFQETSVFLARPRIDFRSLFDLYRLSGTSKSFKSRVRLNMPHTHGEALVGTFFMLGD